MRLKGGQLLKQNVLAGRTYTREQQRPRPKLRAQLDDTGTATVQRNVCHRHSSTNHARWVGGQPINCPLPSALFSLPVHAAASTSSLQLAKRMQPRTQGCSFARSLRSVPHQINQVPQRTQATNNHHHQQQQQRQTVASCSVLVDLHYSSTL